MAISDSNGFEGRKAELKPTSLVGEADLRNSAVRRRPVAGGAEAVSPEVGNLSDGDSPSSTVDRGGDMDRNGGRGADRPPRKASAHLSDFTHREVRESPLSTSSIFRQSHAGLFNLCIVLLGAVNSRLIIENLMKYGWLIKTGFWFSSTTLRDWPLLMCCLTLPIFPLAAFAVEKLILKKHISESVAILLHVILTTVAVLYPVFVIHRCDSAVPSGIALMLFTCINWLKLVSYAHSSYMLRTGLESSLKREAKTAHSNANSTYNVSFKSLAYFIVAPTLCYQQAYPRTDNIRKGYLSWQVFKLVVFTGFMGFIIEQYINPIVQNSEHPLKGNFLYAIERILKLSVPNLYVWLCMFYVFFHLWLNILAELLHFGDREFYKDWWNAKTVEEYWRLWNMPVHNWLVRHVYRPCRNYGLRRDFAFIVVFLVSAIFHELCIAVPCHIFKFWAFLGIMFQVPLVIVTRRLHEKFENAWIGNMIFWFTFCIFGQPMCLLLYYHDVMNQKDLARNKAAVAPLNCNACLEKYGYPVLSNSIIPYGFLPQSKQYYDM